MFFNNEQTDTKNSLETIINSTYKELTGQAPKQQDSPEKVLRKIFSFFRNLLDQMPGHVYWQDKNNVFLGCNDRVAKNAGLNCSGEMIGKTNYEMPWGEQADLFNNLNNKVMQTLRPHIAEESAYMHLHGEIRHFLSEKKPLLNEEGELIGMLGVSLDITDLKAIEAALIEAKEKEEQLRRATMIFSGSIVHDLRTPLMSIKMLANYLDDYLPSLLEAVIFSQQSNNPLSKNIDGKKIHSLQEAPANLIAMSDHLNDFINQSLKSLNKTVHNLSSPENLTVCSLWKCLARILTQYPFVKNEKELIHWDRSCSFDFMGNPIDFYRIFFNLIKNSLQQIQQHNQGEIFIRSEKADSFNFLYFKDTAGQVTPEIISSIFESYRTTKADGTGVGLSFCKLTMQSFDGDITCSLVDGDCIEFILKFPMVSSMKDS